MSDIAARRQAHAEALPVFPWLSVAQLMRRWGVSRSTVLAIPADELPFKTFGKPGSKRPTRRYHPDDVNAYDAIRVGRAA